MKSKGFLKLFAFVAALLITTVVLSVFRQSAFVRAEEETKENTSEEAVEATEPSSDTALRFTKERITYEVTKPIDEKDSIRIGEVKIVDNSLKSSVTSCSITLYVFNEGKEYRITEIGDGAFAFSKLEQIIIPYHVQKIGKAAFYGSASLSAITIGGSISYIGDGAFSYCESLENITVANENTHYRIYEGMLYTSSYETLISSVNASGDVVLHKNTRLISQYAFEGNSKITSVECNSKLTAIDDHAFYDCANLKSVSINASLSTVSGNPFGYCPNLTEINVAKKNKKYKSEGAILLTKSGKTLISCPSVSDDRFVLPEKVKYIGAYAFCGNVSLSAIKIPSGIKTIGAGAFYGCPSLKKVTFESCKTALLPVPDSKSEQVFGNTTHYLAVHVPYGKASDEFKNLLKLNCPSGSIYVEGNK